MNIKKHILYMLPAALTLGLGSCTDYLDKEADTDVSADDAFGNFRNFQGYIEEVHLAIPTKTLCYWNTTFNWGEDEILSTAGNSPYVTYNMDQGNFRAYFQNWGGNLTYLYGNTDRSNNRMNNHIVNSVWYCVRKCNLGLENLNKLVNATDEERRTIEGELLFYRAWWQEEMLIYFGGLPYQTSVPDASSVLDAPRLTLQETALLAAQDFEAAAALLPDNWDKSSVGAGTSGHNELRITKATALAYAGKMYLYAASPLAENGAQVGASKNGVTYKYNTEYATKAATLLGNCIADVEAGKTPYELASYDYADIYDHEPNKGVTNIFSEIFWTQNKNWKQPGGKEAMMRGTVFGTNGARWGEATNWGPNKSGLCEGGFCCTPTANYVNYAYGTADGYRLADAPETSFDKTHPFKNRDNRFYHDIVFDGFEYINGDTKDYADYKYCTLYTDGLMRDAEKNSRTGYFCQKIFPHTCNKVDDAFGFDKSGESYLPYLRLADVYLMYAEACAAVDGANGKYGATDKTARDAINVLRDRVGVAHVLDIYAGDKNTFMDEVRRERACELAFEGFRYNDLARWLLLTEYPYTIKTSQEFTRDDPDFDFSKQDPRDAKVANWKEETILTRNFDTKHYFFPFRDADVYIYSGFAQNPGW